MKTLVVTIAFMCYLAVSSGVIVNLHYCMNRLASTELFTPKSSECGKCGMDIHKSNDCCHDEIQYVKMDDDQRVAAMVSFELPSVTDAGTVPSAFLVAPFYPAPGLRHFINHSPPLLSANDSYLQNRVFRI